MPSQPISISKTFFASLWDNSFLRIGLFIVTVLGIGFSLVLRISYRGPYYPGWDTLGQAHGLFLLSTESLLYVVNSILYSTRHFQFLMPTNSLLFTLIPGSLGSLWPWEYWSHLLTFGIVLVTLGTMAKATSINFQQLIVLLLGFGASSSILSFSVAGYYYATGFLPHALALWIVLHRKLQSRWFFTLILVALTCELSWHLYNLGRTVFLVFLIAAILLRNVSIPTRLVWGGIAIAQIFAILTWRGNDVGSYIDLSQIGIHEISAAIVELGRAIFVTQVLDILVLFILGVASFFFMKTQRWLLLALFVVQLALVFWLTVKGDDLLRPRRFLIVEFYCLIAIVFMFRDCNLFLRYGRALKAGIITILIGGNLWQIAHLMAYTQTPVQQQLHALPHTYSQADYRVQTEEVNWYLELRSQVDAGKKLLLIYNFSPYWENPTDMVGVLERLYLHLGNQKFIDSVFAFSSVTCRYSCLPIRTLEELDPFLEKLISQNEADLENVIGFYTPNPLPTYQHSFAIESAQIFETIRKRFSINLLPSNGSKFRSFTLEGRYASTQNVVAVSNHGVYESLPINGESVKTKPFNWLKLPLDLLWLEETSISSEYILQRPWPNQSFSLRFYGTLYILESGTYEFLLGADDGASLKLNNQPIIYNNSPQEFQLKKRSLPLEKGSYSFEIAYVDFGNTAHLIFDVNQKLDVNQKKDSQPPTIIKTNKVPLSLKQLLPNGLNGHYFQSIDWSGDRKSIDHDIPIMKSLEFNWNNHLDSVPKPWPSFSLRLTGTMNIKEPGLYHFEQ